MDAVSDFEEDAVASHGVRNARAAEHRGVHRAESRDGHGDSDPERRAASRDLRDYIRRDVRRSGNADERQHFQASGTEEQIDDRYEGDSADQRARKIALGIFYLGADEIQILPAVVSPESGSERR